MRAQLPAAVRLAERDRQLTTLPRPPWRGAVRVGSGTGGLVVRLHGPAWSLVFRVSPVPYPVLVCTDELTGHAWRIDQDPDWKPEIEHTMMAVVGQLSRHGIGGDRYQPPRLPRRENQDG